jgi:hypothetical protein
MRCSLVTALAVLVLALVGAQAAGATIYTPGHFSSDNPGASFSGYQIGTGTYTVWNTAHSAQYTFACTTTSYTGTKPGGLATALTVGIQFNNCAVNMGGIRHVTPEACGEWQLNANSYNSVSGATTGGFTNCRYEVLHVDALSFCHVLFSWASFFSGLTIQDRNWSDTANATHLTAAGMRVRWSGVSMGYTSTCPGIESPGTGTFSAEGFIPGVWVGP